MEYEEIVFETEEQGVVYPCLVSSIESEEEFSFFKRFLVKDTPESIPLFFYLDGTLVELGPIPMKMSTFLTMRSIGIKTVELRKFEGNSVTINLDDPETFVKLVEV